MTDQELTEGILRHDRAAFRLLVERYQRQVIKTACHFLGNMEDAEDLSQEVFVEVIRSIGMFRRSATLSTWIYRITVNKSLNALKRKRREGIMMKIESLFRSPAGNHSAEPVTLETGGDEEENRKLLHEAIRCLPENQRIAFVLHKLEERPHKEIAEIMQIGVPAVESLIPAGCGGRPGSWLRARR